MRDLKIKVEGLEETKWITECVDEVVHNITGKKRSNIHLFVNQNQVLVLNHIKTT